MGVLGHGEPTGHRDGVFGLWEREGRVLLVSNPRVAGGRRGGVWDLPGGAVRPGEGLVGALSREWREEVGLEAEVGRLLHVADGAKRRSEDAPALYTWRAFVFAVESEGEPRPGAGIEALDWVPRAEAASRLDAPYHEPLRRWLADGETVYGAVQWIDPLPADGRGASAPADGLRRLLGIAAAAAAGATDLVAREVEAACAEGIAPERIEETLLQIVPYAGFPRTIAAFGAARPRLGPYRPPSEPSPPCSTGPQTFDAVYVETADRIRAELGTRHPELLAWIQAFAYGRVLARPGLSLLERELLAVSILTALGNLEGPLLGHMRAAVRLGAAPADVAAAVEAVPHALGEAHRDAARALLDRL